MAKYRMLALLGLLLVLLSGCVVASDDGGYSEPAPPGYYSEPFYGGGWLGPGPHHERRQWRHEERREERHEGRHGPYHGRGTAHPGRSDGGVGRHEWGGHHGPD